MALMDLAPSLLNLFNRVTEIFGWEWTEACIIFGMVSGITLIFSGKAARTWGISRFRIYLKTRKEEFGLSIYTRGVTMWDGNTWRKIGEFASDQPLSLFEDSSGAVWIGFNLHGAVKYENARLKSYPTNLSTFLETPDHRLFGGGRERLFLFNLATDEWEKYPPSK